LSSMRICLSFVTVLLLVAPATASAQGCPNESLRGGAAERLPDCRAYEMVSPLDKNGAVIDLLQMGGSAAPGATLGVAPDGNAVAFPAVGAVFAGNESSPFGAGQYVSTRGEASAWSTRGINPLMVPQPIVAMDAPVYLLSHDLSQAVVASNALLAPGAERLDGVRRILYRQDNTARPFAHELLSLPSAPITPQSINDFHVAGATRDFSHFVFLSEYQLTPDGPPPGLRELYEWDNGEVRFVARRPDGGFFPTEVIGIPGGRDVFSLQFFPGDHFLSDDGRRIYFTADGLYVREDGTETRLVSGSERASDDPDVPTPVQRIDGAGISLGFQFAKADDGSVAFFTSESKLTDDATAGGAGGHDLYRWDADAGPGDRLSDVTATDPAGAGVRGVAAATDDASHVYFIADGVLTPDTPQPANRQPRLYLWRQGGGLRFVATLGSPGVFDDPSIVSKSRDAGPTVAYRDARVTSDGQRLLFASHAKLTDYDNAGHKAIYLYDAATDGITCVSCSPIATSSSADAHLLDLTGDATTGTNVPLDLPRNLSTNGRRVVFEAEGRLVPEDGNGEKDVYLWEDGALHLVSSGQSGASARLIGAGADLDDIFFVTDDPLVGADLDDHVDVYDARVEGGIPAQHPQPSSPCEGEDCQGAMSGPPLLPGVGSAFGSHGDLHPRARPSFSVTKLTRAQRAKLARGRRVMLRVRVNRAGRVSLTGRAKLGKRVRTVARASKSARRASAVRLSLRLSSSARRALARKEMLRVRLVVRFAGVREARTSTATLRRARRSGERGTR